MQVASSLKFMGPVICYDCTEGQIQCKKHNSEQKSNKKKPLIYGEIQMGLSIVP